MTIPNRSVLSDEQISLLDGLLWINDFAPEFKEYVQEFPEGKLDGIEDLATWEKVQVGFKTVIINTHTILYKKEDDSGIPQGLSTFKANLRQSLFSFFDVFNGNN